MITLTWDEQMVLLLYGAETRTESIRNLQEFQADLTGRDRNLRSWTGSLLQKLMGMTDGEFDAMDRCPDLSVFSGMPAGSAAETKT